MTARQMRLGGAGLLLLRATATVGGLLGAVFLATALTGQQRLIFLVLVLALAMPLVLVGLAGSLRCGGWTLFGLALGNAVVFVDPAAYLALAFVAGVGATLMFGSRVSIRQARGRPLS
jgi:hypothetical protein